MSDNAKNACGCGCIDICRAEEVKDDAAKLADFRAANPGCTPKTCACGKANAGEKAQKG